MTHKKPADLENDSGAYVLNALDKQEQIDFETQLGESEELRNEVTELTDTAVLLGMAVEPVTPSAALKESLMAKLATTQQLSRDVPPVRALHAVSTSEESSETTSDETANEPPVALNTKAQLRWFQKPMMVAAAAVAAVLIVSGGVVGITVATDHTQQVQQADVLAAIYSAPDSQRAETSVASGGKATLVWSHALGKSALIVKGLGVLPSDKAYELWYINSKGEPTRAGMLKGSDTWRVLDGRMAKGDTVGITIEPSGGSNQPTTKPIVAIASA